ncbi:MAG: hypothetical protein BJ554DRAFT_7436, partial [Olpidium bornovanus]
MHSWPTLLAMLGWLVELNLCLERIYDDPEAEASAGFSQEFGVNCDGQAPKSTAGERLPQSRHDSRDRAIAEGERASKSADISDGRERDHKKFKEYIHHLENRMAKLKEQNSRTKQELSSTASQIAQLRAEKAQVQAVVDAQELSPADVDRMTAEREELRNQIAAVSAHQVQASQAAWEKEIAVQRRLDAVDRLVAAYNRLMSTLRLECNEEFVTVSRPSGPAVVGDEDDGGMDTSRRLRVLKVNVHATRADAMVSLDLRNKIKRSRGHIILLKSAANGPRRLATYKKPALQVLREKMATLAHSSQNEVISHREDLERLNDQIADKKDELASLQQRLDQAGISCTEQKKACTQIAAASNAQMKSMEDKLSVMKREGFGDLITAKQRKQNMTMECVRDFRRLPAR